MTSTKIGRMPNSSVQNGLATAAFRHVVSEWSNVSPCYRILLHESPFFGSCIVFWMFLSVSQIDSTLDPTLHIFSQQTTCHRSTWLKHLCVQNLSRQILETCHAISMVVWSSSSSFTLWIVVKKIKKTFYWPWTWLSLVSSLASHN